MKKYLGSINTIVIVLLISLCSCEHNDNLETNLKDTTESYYLAINDELKDYSNLIYEDFKSQKSPELFFRKHFVEIKSTTKSSQFIDNIDFIEVKIENSDFFLTEVGQII